MIKSTRYSATFKSTGETLKGEFQPPAGTTAVVGPNGTGKTFGTIEVARWLLYGKAALRGAASDYDTLEGEGTFTIRGQDYRVVRTPKREYVEDATGEQLAVGAKEVNKKMIELMGYDLDVFDICNASTQKNVDLFTKRKPAERKRMVDQVAGLLTTAAAEKACREEAAAYKRDAATLATALRAPSADPVRPEGYAPSKDVREELRVARFTKEQMDEIRGGIRFAVEPTQPTLARTTPTEIAIVERHEDQRRAVEQQRTSLKTIGTTSYTLDQIAAAERRAAVRKQLDDRGPKPQVTRDEVETELAAWAVLDAYKPSDEVECPKCHTTFRPTGEPPRTPTWSRDYLRKQQQAHLRWPDDGPALPDGPDLTPQQVRTAQAQHEAGVQLAGLPVLDDKSRQLASLRTSLAEHSAYARDVERYAEILKENETLTRALELLGPVPDVDPIYERLVAADRYEASVLIHAKETETFVAASAVIEEKLRLAAEFARGSTELAEARATVKALLAPLISRRATELIYDMTNGKLTSVTVDDDMEIYVDGQPVHTLSGAGITVANIALRIAVGQVLVGSTFPVFIGDEIDGDLDEERRQATVEAMVGLKKHLSQIILITHRAIGEVDFVHDTR